MGNIGNIFYVSWLKIIERGILTWESIKIPLLLKIIKFLMED